MWRNGFGTQAPTSKDWKTQKTGNYLLEASAMEGNHKNYDSLLDANYFGSPVQNEVDDCLVIMLVVSKPHQEGAPPGCFTLD